MANISTNGDTSARAPTIGEIVIAADPTRWEALGFLVSGAVTQLGAVRIRLTGLSTNPDAAQDADRDRSDRAGRGILEWSLRGIANCELDGLPTTRSDSPPSSTASKHPNGVTAIDHVVAVSPALDRTVQALQAAGLDLRRIREQPTPAGAPRQAFFRLGETILEVVQEPEQVVQRRPEGADGRARFWGLALLTDDLDRTVARLGEHSSEVRPAVQPGRQIATLRSSAGLGIPIALMSRAVAFEES